MIRLVIVFLGFMLAVSLNASQAQEPSGLDLIKRLNCQGCHTLNSQGGKLGPNLNKVVQYLSSEAITKQLVSPEGGMPSFAYLKPAELDAIVTYLSGLK